MQTRMLHSSMMDWPVSSQDPLPALHAGFLADAQRNLHPLLWQSHCQLHSG